MTLQLVPCYHHHLVKPTPVFAFEQDHPHGIPFQSKVNRGHARRQERERRSSQECQQSYAGTWLRRRSAPATVHSHPSVPIAIGTPLIDAMYGGGPPLAAYQMARGYVPGMAVSVAELASRYPPAGVDPVLSAI